MKIYVQALGYGCPTSQIDRVPVGIQPGKSNVWITAAPPDVGKVKTTGFHCEKVFSNQPCSGFSGLSRTGDMNTLTNNRMVSATSVAGSSSERLPSQGRCDRADSPMRKAHQKSPVHHAGCRSCQG